MRVLCSFLAAGIALSSLDGCAQPSAAARQRAAAQPQQTPRGIVSSFPPRDPSFYPLRCLTLGPNTECKRDTD